ncbi:MAG: radical SAM protein [Proteobacteria bacterium]|nr:radical SAM protein [Pseudomonadota bacterium]MBU1388000.1 radical SAM protein [Pseudomonadota bacterium]MBU1542063.1 radical SAM protein [Pseudomonadota bacterium]MBU2430629.1 radical SAM protein [Pseudomonadota bacterium]MBU2482847.1 radical SAM protein [Pseudomonadota bacterium]
MDRSEKPLVIPVFIPHAGCPHQCAFCNQSIITRQSDSALDKTKILPVIEDYLQYKGSRKSVELAFFGGNFLGLPEEKIIELLEIIQPYIKENKIDSIRFSTRPDTISQSILDTIRPFNISAVELGVQSMNDDILKKNRRGHTCEDIISAISLLKKNGFKIGVQVMAGLPGDTQQDLLKSTRILAQLEPDFARIYPLMVLKGSLVEKWYRQGEYTPLSLDTAIGQVKQMYGIFSQAGIDVIRMGLQASDFMEDETKVIAGPWHPAFGHLVFSAMMYDLACKKIDAYRDLKNTGHLAIRLHPCSESRFRGNKNSNIINLKKKYPDLDFSIVLDEAVSMNQVIVSEKS